MFETANVSFEIKVLVEFIFFIVTFLF